MLPCIASLLVCPVEVCSNNCLLAPGRVVCQEHTSTHTCPQANRPCRGAGDFANGSAGGKFVTSSGDWLDHPLGVLQATNGSANMTTALVSLASPRYDAARNTLTFQVRLTWLAVDHPLLPLGASGVSSLV